MYGYAGDGVAPTCASPPPSTPRRGPARPPPGTAIAWTGDADRRLVVPADVVADARAAWDARGVRGRCRRRCARSSRGRLFRPAYAGEDPVADILVEQQGLQLRPRQAPAALARRRRRRRTATRSRSTSRRRRGRAPSPRTRRSARPRRGRAPLRGRDLPAVDEPRADGRAARPRPARRPAGHGHRGGAVLRPGRRTAGCGAPPTSRAPRSGSPRWPGLPGTPPRARAPSAPGWPGSAWPSAGGRRRRVAPTARGRSGCRAGAPPSRPGTSPWPARR